MQMHKTRRVIMRQNYLFYVKKSLKSMKFWFAFIIIILSAVSTSIFNFANDEGTNLINIGRAEFFIYSTLIGNTLLQISVPIIPFFVVSDIFGLNIEEIIPKNITSRILAAFTINSCLFTFAFSVITVYSVLFYPASSGEMFLIGIASEIYNLHPFLIIPFTIIHSCFFACAYALFGIGIDLNLTQKSGFATAIPLAYYFSYQYISYLIPEKIISAFHWTVPILTFEVEGLGVPIIKNIVEIFLIFTIGLFLIFIAYSRRYKLKRFRQNIEAIGKNNR